MKLKLKQTLAPVVAFLIMGQSAYAEESKMKLDTNKVKIKKEGLLADNNDDPIRWIPFGALGLSAVTFNKSRSEEDGTAANLRLIGSYYEKSRKYVFDAGLGFETAELISDNVNSGLIELAARRRFGATKKWHAGPVANMNVGKDVGIGYGSSVDSLATFLGAQVIRDFVYEEKSIVRLGLKAMTDIGIPNVTANKFLFEMQFGQVLDSQIVQNNTIAQAPKKERDGLVAVPKSFYFKTGSFDVAQKNKNLLDRVSKVLKENKGKIKKLKLIGFSDERGAEQRNLKLSERRAQALRKALKENGVDGLIVEEIGAGELTLKEVENKLWQARRVDVEIVGKASEVNEMLKALEEQVEKTQN